MVTMNYLVIPEDAPTTVHFTDHFWIEKMIWDKQMQKEKPVRSLTFWVDEVNGVPEFRTFSVISSQLVDMLYPYLPDSRFRDFDFTITKRGSGFLTRWEIEANPRSPLKP